MAHLSERTTQNMTTQEETRSCGAVVSDLHLFTNRTTVYEYMPAIRKAADTCRVFIFNGDIFDFHWSFHTGFVAAVKAAEQWIFALASQHPYTRFVFLLGNHDSIAEYSATLDKLSHANHNIEWSPNWYRINDKLFLHGDVYHAGSDIGRLAAYRKRCNLKLRRSRLRHACYWAFARSGLPQIFLLMVNRKTCARQILAYLSQELGDEMHQVREVFFGHIHTTFTNFEYQNVLFHNTGSATKGARLSVLRFALHRVNPDFGEPVEHRNEEQQSSA